MRKIIAAITVLLIACATPYGGYGLLGGYTDSRSDGNTFSISVNNNAFTSQQTTSMHALYRAGEITVGNGFDYFVIASGANNPSSMAVAMPGGSTSSTSINTYGSTVTTTTTTRYAPVTAIPLVFPNSALIIKSFKGQKPDDQPNAYDAREVMKYLGPQIGVGQGR